MQSTASYFRQGASTNNTVLSGFPVAPAKPHQRSQTKRSGSKQSQSRRLGSRGEPNIVYGDFGVTENHGSQGRVGPESY